MATPKRLTRTYHFKGVIYTPETPASKIPKELIEREKYLDSPAYQKKKARQAGTIPAVPIAHLVPKSTEKPVDDEEMPSVVMADAGENPDLIEVEETDSDSEEDDG